MADAYQIPSLLLTTLLLPVFAQLYLRFRDTRTLLWLLGFLFSIFRMLQVYQLGFWDLRSPILHPWVAAFGQSAILISSAFFLASLSPLGFRVGRFRVLYAVPFAAPLVAYALLLDGVFHGTPPSNLLFLIFPALGAMSLFFGCFWGWSRGKMPVWIGLGLCIVLGGAALWICVRMGGAWPLTFVESSLHLVMVLLIFFVFQRISPGTVISGLGFLAWCGLILLIFPAIGANPELRLDVLHVTAIGKVIAAIGMLVLALEDELAIRSAAQQRERSARKELEAYTGLVITRRRVEDFDRQSTEVCRLIAEHSRFTQVAIVLRQAYGPIRLAGAAGMNDATINAIDAVAMRIPPQNFLDPEVALPVAEHAQTRLLDFTPWLTPGDDLRALHVTQVLATPLQNRGAVEGAILLAAPRHPEFPIEHHDLLPVEVLAARLQGARNSVVMLEKLIDAEKFAGLGQLASNVTRQLNNPLTVILGYASLLQETEDLNAQTRKGIDAILTEARNMRATLESLSRMSRAQNDNFAAISIIEMLNDMEQLHRSEFVHRAIAFRLQISPTLPRVLCNAQQIRQAILYCLQFAIEAVENLDLVSDKSVRVEAATEGSYVRILISHTGPGFLHPDRAFDPFVPAQATGETAGLGLSLCATILRQNNGRISAINYEPRGAAILLELQAA